MKLSIITTSFLLIFCICHISAEEELYTSLLGLLSESEITADDSYNCTVPNDCSYYNGRPYCINGLCRQCNPEAGEKGSSCECRAGQYCIKYPQDPNYGFCREYESNIIGRNCDIRLTNGMKTIQGANDTVFCGRVIYGVDLKAEFVEWSGSCQVGVCKQCDSPLVPTVPISICNDGRSCLEGYEIYAPVGAFSLTYVTQSPLFTAYYVAIVEVAITGLVFLFTFFGFYYYYRKGQQKEKRNQRLVNPSIQ